MSDKKERRRVREREKSTPRENKIEKKHRYKRGRG